MKLPKARVENIVVQEAGAETFVYDRTTDKAYYLNETTAFVWRMCDGVNDLAAVSQALAAKTNQPVNEDVVKLAIDQLKAIDLFDEPEKLKDFFTKTSRRRAIRQIGLTTMVALPVIYSLTAPTAANAASGRGTTAACQPCTSGNQCASGRCRSTPGGNSTICSNGTNSYRATSPNFAFYSVNDSTRCNSVAAEFCCSGSGTFNPATPNGRGCTCNP